MSAVRPTYHYDLAKITEFNPAIIYGFEPEKDTHDLDPNQKPLEYMTHTINQHEDMFNAYVYAETIVKRIREQGTEIISAQNILRWLQEIHHHIAKTLAEDKKNHNLAGQYTPFQVTRWHQTGAVADHLQNKFSADIALIKKNEVYHFTPFYDDAFEETKTTRLKSAMLNRLVQSITHYEDTLKELGVSVVTANKFLAMMHKYYNQPCKLSNSEQGFLNTSHHPLALLSMKGMTLVTHAWHEGLLSVEEKQTFDNLAKVCYRPEEMSARMNKFAALLAEKWQQCDGTNLREVAKLCHFAFYQSTEIHPFFNGNGRTATCLINIILRSLKHPHSSISLRDPGNKSDEQSSYSKAINNIDAQPELLEEHIYARIVEANKGKGFSDLQLKNVIKYRLEIVTLGRVFLKEFPQFNINELILEKATTSCEAAMKAIQTQPTLLINTQSVENLIGSLSLPVIIESIKKQLQTLRANKSIALSAVSSPVQRQYSAQERLDIINKMESLTGLKGWKQNSTNGLAVWLEAVEIDKETAKTLANLLNISGALKASCATKRGTQILVIMLKEINPSKLENIFALDGWNKPSAITNVRAHQ